MKLPNLTSILLALTAASCNYNIKIPGVTKEIYERTEVSITQYNDEFNHEKYLIDKSSLAGTANTNLWHFKKNHAVWYMDIRSNGSLDQLVEYTFNPNSKINTLSDIYRSISFKNKPSLNEKHQKHYKDLISKISELEKNKEIRVVKKTD